MEFLTVGAGAVIDSFAYLCDPSTDLPHTAFMCRYVSGLIGAGYVMFDGCSWESYSFLREDRGMLI